LRVRVVIVGGGVVGLALARALLARGIEPVVLERMPPGRYVPRGFMLGFQGFTALEELGIMAEVRAAGWDIAPRANGDPVAVCVAIGRLLETLGRDVPVRHGVRVTDLLRGDGRVVGVAVGGPDAAGTLGADLVVAADGAGSPTRALAGLPVEVTPLPEGQMMFLSPAVIDHSFAMAPLAGGRVVGLLGWPEGSSGWRSVERVGREAALAPGLDAFRRAFATLLPEAEPALAALTSTDQLAYVEPAIVRCPRWWAPGVILVGDSAHPFGPETGIGAGLGLGDAQALAEAIARHPEDPDAACRDYEHWRAPAVRPYEAADPALERMAPLDPSERPAAERWPPS
jgi:2-polyprenyl-6-methoxyphenol hydroxylase-like FAD-dependent oxidoreductase